MHVMHGAVLVSLIGFLVAVGRLATTVPKAISAGGFEHPTAMISVSLMALLCGVHVGLCVKSFIDARRRRKQAASTSTGQVPT
jgi:hypothetical protein